MQEQNTKEKFLEYLEKSYTMIQRLTETNKIITVKNKELFAKNMFLHSEIKRLEKENRLLKNKSNLSQDDFEIV